MDDSFVTGVAIIALGVLIAVVFVIVRLSKETPKSASQGLAPQICATCGRIGHPRVDSPGSPIVEVLLWMFVIIPGVFYTLWRRGLEKKVCRSCGSKEMVPLNSPRGIELQDHYHKPKIVS